MTFRLFIVKKMNTLLNETIHIMLWCVMYFHGHRNKVVPLLKPSNLQILTMPLNFATAPASRLMTFKAIVSYVESITTTSTMKTWFFRIM
jgi:hypothetical protein